MLAIALVALPVAVSADYAPNYTCAIMDKFECVARPECGWCECSYTCMRADENGPLPGSRTCPDSHGSAVPWTPINHDTCVVNFSLTKEDLENMTPKPARARSRRHQQHQRHHHHHSGSGACLRRRR